MGQSSSSPAPPPTISEEEAARNAMMAAMGGFAFGTAGGDFLSAVQRQNGIDLNVINMDGQQAEMRDKYNALSVTYNTINDQHTAWRNQGDQVVSTFRTAAHAATIKAFTQLEHTLVLILACSDSELRGTDTRAAQGLARMSCIALPASAGRQSNPTLMRSTQSKASPPSPALPATWTAAIQLNANSTAVPAALSARVQNMTAAADATRAQVAPQVHFARFAVPAQTNMMVTRRMGMAMVANAPSSTLQTPEQKRNQVFDSIDGARTAFKDLKEVGEALHTGMCTLSQLGQNLIGFLTKEKDDVNTLLQQIQDVIGTDQNSFNDRIHRFAEFNAQAAHYEDMIHRYDEKNFIEKWFCPNAHDQYGAIAAKTRDLATQQMFCAIQMGRMINITNIIKHYAEELARKVQETYTLTQKEQNDVLDAKNRSQTLYDRLYDLMNAFATRDVFLTVDNAVRHILQVVTNDAEILFDDAETRTAKENMIKDIKQHYGEPKATDLILHPRYVARASDDFSPDTPNLEAKAVALSNVNIEWNGGPRWEQLTTWPVGAVAGKASLLPVLKAMSSSNRQNVRFIVWAEGDNSAAIQSWADTRIDMLRMSCLSLDPSDPRFRFGIFTFERSSNWVPDLYDADVWVATTTITFDKPFRSAPKIPVFLCRIDEEHSNESYSTMTAAVWTENVGALSFTLCAKVWGGRKDIYGLGVQWIAHDPYDTTLRIGSIRHDSDD